MDYPSTSRHDADYVMDFGGQLNQYIVLCELSYSNIYYSIVDIGPMRPYIIDVVGPQLGGFICWR